jgi:hypothetical protein
LPFDRVSAEVVVPGVYWKSFLLAHDGIDLLSAVLPASGQLVMPFGRSTGVARQPGLWGTVGMEKPALRITKWMGNIPVEAAAHPVPK